MASHEFANAHRLLPSDFENILRLPVVAILGVKLSHGMEVLEYMLRQVVTLELLFTPLVKWQVMIGDRSSERVRIFSGYGVHVLRARPSQFVDFPDMRSRLLQYCGNYSGDIVGSYRRSFR